MKPEFAAAKDCEKILSVLVKRYPFLDPDSDMFENFSHAQAALAIRDLIIQLMRSDALDLARQKGLWPLKNVK